MAATHTSAVIGRRMCAGLAVCSAVLHGALIGLAGHAGSIAVDALILAMAAGCLFCACELWVDGSLRAWCLVAVMNLGMIAVHFSVPGHHHGAALPGSLSVAAPSTVMMVAITLSALEVVIAAAVLLYRTRDRAQTLLASSGREAW